MAQRSSTTRLDNATAPGSLAPRPVVLVLDYPGQRPEAMLSELRLEDAGFDVRYLLVRPLPQELSAEKYAQGALKAAGDISGGVHAVLAYCMSAALAPYVATLASAEHLLLFDAERSTAKTVADELQSILRSFNSADTLPDWWCGETLKVSPATLLERINSHLFDAIRAALAADSDPSVDEGQDQVTDQVARSMVRTYMDWFSHLVAAHGHAPESFNGPWNAAHIVSDGHVLPDGWRGVACLPRHTVETSRRELARADETQSLALRLLQQPLT
ncbi:hypothetical protein [Streptomyces sp. NPDC047525]|uniref:hypothetical protein n=1 Tax=Streptomyces sp. NPDC047525 TaxID=3155264 RepID=UPI0033ED59F7